MQLGVTIDGDLRQGMVQEVLATEKAVTSAIRRASTGIKTEVRNQVKSAGLGERFANTIRNNVYPEARNSINAAGYIFCAARSKYGFYGNVFEEGATISARNAKWLAIPMGKSYVGNKRVRMEDMKNLNLQFVPTRKPNIAFLVQRISGRPDIPLFTLVKQVRIRKSIDAMAVSEKWADRVPGFITSELDKGS